MDRVLVATLAWGLLLEKENPTRVLKVPQAGTLAAINTTVYVAATGGATIAAGSFFTNADGHLPGYVEEGKYTLTIGATSFDVSAVNGTLAARVESAHAIVAAPTGVEATDAASIATALATIRARSNKGVLFFQAGQYNVDTTSAPAISIGANESITIAGVGIGAISSPAGNTIIRRTVGTNPILQATGTGDTAAGRAYVAARDIEFNGGNLAGTVVRLDRVNEVYFRRVRLKLSTQKGLHGTQVYNSTFNDVFVTSCGSGTTHPAVLFDAIPGAVVNGHSHTIHWIGGEFEGNTGTDLKLSGNADPAILKGLLAFLMTNVKMERTIAAMSWPFIDLDIVSGCVFSDLQLAANGGSSKFITSSANTTVARGSVNFANVSMVHSDIEAIYPTEFIVLDGSQYRYNLTNISCEGSPSNKYIRITSLVGFKAVAITNFYGQGGVLTAVDDLRVAASVNKLDQGWAPCDVTFTGAGVTVVESTPTAYWELHDGATEYLILRVRVPSDSRDGSTPEVRVMWGASVATGVVKWLANCGVLTVGGDLAPATSNPSPAPAAPAAGKLAVTAFAPSITPAPGDMLTIKLSRLGADAADTMAGTARVVGVDLVYNKYL